MDPHLPRQKIVGRVEWGAGDEGGAVLHAYMLVTVLPGTAAAVVAALRLVEGVHRAETVTGPYDIVVDVAAVDVDRLGVMVQEHVQRVPGVARTLTCPVFHL